PYADLECGGLPPLLPALHRLPTSRRAQRVTRLSRSYPHTSPSCRVTPPLGSGAPSSFCEGGSWVLSLSFLRVLAKPPNQRCSAFSLRLFSWFPDQRLRLLYLLYLRTPPSHRVPACGDANTNTTPTSDATALPLYVAAVNTQVFAAAVAVPLNAPFPRTTITPCTFPSPPTCTCKTTVPDVTVFGGYVA